MNERDKIERKNREESEMEVIQREGRKLKTKGRGEE